MFISKLEKVGGPHKCKKIRKTLVLTCASISKQKNYLFKWFVQLVQSKKCLNTVTYKNSSEFCTSVSNKPLLIELKVCTFTWM